MKAIILASGTGKRLKPLTDKIPKPLVKVGSLTILERIINSLVVNNIKDIIITTGPFEEKIKALIDEKYPGPKVTYVKNPLFDQTNYIYSLWLARDAVKDEDVVLIHGDMFFEKKLMKGVVESQKSCALVRNNKEVPEKDFKARIEGGLIKEISVNVFGENARFLAPVFKILKEDFRVWFDKMGEFVKAGNTNVYAENALNEIMDKVKIHPIYYNDEYCIEIDNFEDLEKAKSYLGKEI